MINDEIRQAQGNEEFHFGNPINAHLFIKHLTVEWDQIKTLLSDEFLKIFSDQWIFPTIEDYKGKDEEKGKQRQKYLFDKGSALALMRLQDTYKLSPNQLANGKISSKFRSKPLNGRTSFLHFVISSNFIRFSFGMF